LELELMKHLFRLLLAFVAGILIALPLGALAQRKHVPVLPDTRPRIERTVGVEGASIHALFQSPDGGKIHPVLVLKKWNDSPKDTDPGFTLQKLHAWLSDPKHIPDEVVTCYGNLTMTAGSNLLLTKGIGGAGQAFDSTHCCVVVGDGTGTASAGATDISETTHTTAHRWNQAADSTYPQVSTNVLTIVVTVTSSNALFTWNEWSINNHASATLSGNEAQTLTGNATMLNWKSGAALGTHAAGTWTGTWTYTLS
jgi:hypothetical protein